MPKPRNINNFNHINNNTVISDHHHQHHSTSNSATFTIPPSILHLNQHQRQSSTSSSSSSAGPHYIHNASYGLLEPTQSRPSRPPIHQRRKSTSSTGSSTWSDRGFDFADFKERSVDLGEKISEALPGVRYSAVFISALRANLVLSSSLAPPSPNLLALSPSILPKRHFLTELSASQPPQYHGRMVIEGPPDPLVNIPDLTFTQPTNSQDKTSGLKLVADILSQQRSQASKALIYNPVFVAIWAAAVGLMYPWVYRNPATDKPSLGITMIGMLIFALAGVRWLVKPYQDLAEEIHWEWLGDDQMVIAKYGSVVIGSCVFRIEDHNGKKNANSKRLLIRAWTTRPRERGRGIGRGTMEKVVDIAKQKNCSGVEFAPDELRAGSKRLLTEYDGFGSLYSIGGGFDEAESKGRALLKSILDEKWTEKKRRGS